MPGGLEPGYSKENVLQKLFPAFPSGWPGFGLLLLRGFVAFTLIVQGATHVRPTEMSVSDWLVAVAVLAGAVLLLMGLMTPIVAILIAVGSLVVALTDHAMIEVTVLTTAITFLGPGAFSIDARMFGRREIRIPTTKNSPETR